MIDHDEPSQQETLEWKGGLALAVSQRPNHLQDSFMVDSARWIQVFDKRSKARLVQMGSKRHQINEPGEFFGEGAPVIQHRDGSFDGGFDGQLPTSCWHLGSCIHSVRKEAE